MKILHYLMMIALCAISQSFAAKVIFENSSGLPLDIEIFTQPESSAKDVIHLPIKTHTGDYADYLASQAAKKEIQIDDALFKAGVRARVTSGKHSSNFFDLQPNLVYQILQGATVAECAKKASIRSNIEMSSDFCISKFSKEAELPMIYKDIEQVILE